MNIILPHSRCQRLAFAGLAALAAAVMSWPVTAADDDVDATVGNVYLAGAEAHTAGPIPGDLVAAAGRIRVDHAVRGDAVLGAGSIEVYGNIGDDLRAAGAVIVVSGRVGGEALLAGGSVSLGPNAQIDGRTWIAGNDIGVGGRLHDGLTIYGKNALLLGEVDGPVEINAEQIEILGSARILGDITYSSNHEIKIEPGAIIAGRVVRKPETFEFYRPHMEFPAWTAFRPLMLLGLLAAGTLLYAVFPRFTQTTAQTISASPLKSIGLGAAIFFSLPPVILLLIITIIGIPIAFALFALYATGLLIGYLRPDPCFGWRIGTLTMALVILMLARHLPYVGGLLIFVALFAGLGAIVLQAFSGYANRAA
jgi:cytoskeletal protein CcmA (bactofilin family)